MANKNKRLLGTAAVSAVALVTMLNIPAAGADDACLPGHCTSYPPGIERAMWKLPVLGWPGYTEDIFGKF